MGPEGGIIEKKEEPAGERLAQARLEFCLAKK